MQNRFLMPPELNMNQILFQIVVLAVWLLLLSSCRVSECDSDFDVRQHLSTISRYETVKDINSFSQGGSDVPESCVAFHLNLVARHGTRSPTKKRMRELDELASNLERLVTDAKEQNVHLHNVPAWIQGWRSPWSDKVKGGELTQHGEDELYHLGIRVRERFPKIFKEEYHPDIYPIKATQVPRASASAVAFGLGLLSEKGILGPGHHRAFAVISESRASDTMLRFHDHCESYKVFRKKMASTVNVLMDPVYDEIKMALVKRHGLNFTKQDTASLWFLCKQEAALLGIIDQACALFMPSEVTLLEWVDDIELFILKGYGNSINYKMGVPLLEDVVQSMEHAIDAQEIGLEGHEKARLRFAHAETVVPFSCLLGLFLERSEFQKIQREEALQLPQKPPKNRTWKGNIVAPYAGNTMLILYRCYVNSSSEYFVQVLHNELPVPIPGCDGTSFCSFEVFKEKVVAPHLKHDYNEICTVKVDEVKVRPRSNMFAFFTNWLFSKDSHRESNNEL